MRDNNLKGGEYVEFLQEITLELNSNTAYTTVGAKQGDRQSRNIKIHITKNGEDWDIPTENTEASYRIRKPDGYAIWNEAIIDYDENVVYINLTEQALAVPGRAYADLLFVSGEGAAKQILSTVSFIIIIMAAPDIIDNITSIDEFGEIIDLTKNAEVILNESEAWADGERAGVPVIGDQFEYHTVGTSGLIYEIDPAVFRQYVGIEYGRTVVYLFTCIENETNENRYGIWQVEWNDHIRKPILTGTGTSPADRPIPDNTTFYMSDYGFSFSDGHALQGNAIQVTVTDHDIQYENNAKYYAQQAQIQEQKIANLTVSAVSGIDADVIKEEDSESYNLQFYLPKGDPGDVNLMTFYIDLEPGSSTYGQIISCSPDSIQSASVKSYPSSMAITFNKNKFLSKIFSDTDTYSFPDTYSFIYDLDSLIWRLNGQSVSLTDFGISYTLKPNQFLLNNDTIVVKGCEQVTFSVNQDTGDLMLLLDTGE